MEMTFYDDSLFRGGPKNEAKGALKRPATLDFESPDTMTKKQKYAAILTSPDLHMLKLASPELERFIISNGNITTTPTPTQFLFSKNATEEQEQYARGFLDALNQLHQTQFEMSPGTFLFGTGNTPTAVSAATSLQASLVQKQPYSQAPPAYSTAATSVIKSTKQTPAQKSLLVVRPPSVDNSCSNNSTSSSSVPMSHLEIAIKEELQTVPSDFSTPPMSPISKGPINLEAQERIKLERKRYRNRLAASKCRKRKLEKISQLEEKVKELKNENSQLESAVDILREQVCSLKQEVMNHVKKGCQIMTAHT